MKKILLFVLIVFSSSFVFAHEPSWSSKIAKSFLRIHPDSIVYAGDQKSKNWNYEQGLMMEALYQTWTSTGDSTYLKYIHKNIDAYITPYGISTYKAVEFQLDNLTPGKTALRLYQQTKNPKYKNVADILRMQLAAQPRTPDGGFWHKKIYPNQMWLDGLYMAEPFYVLYGRMFHDTAIFTDAAHQFLLMAQHARDPKTGLFYHGWDASKKQPWANSETGCSPNFWGRALGWYGMALVDVLDDLPLNHPDRKKLITVLQQLASAVENVQDPKTHLWYQILDKPDAAENYLEASASTMFTYMYAKGVNKGYLPAHYKKQALESFTGILQHFVDVDTAGVVHLLHVCKVSGLGGIPYRDGSIQYYVNEPQRTDDFKGYGPFLLAALEVEKLSPKEIHHGK